MKTGPELIAEIAKYPTIDVVLDRNPLSKPYTDEELDAEIERQRLERTLFTVKSDERQDKRKGQEKLEASDELPEDTSGGGEGTAA